MSSIRLADAVLYRPTALRSVKVCGGRKMPDAVPYCQRDSSYGPDSCVKPAGPWTGGFTFRAKENPPLTSPGWKDAEGRVSSPNLCLNGMLGDQRKILRMVRCDLSKFEQRIDKDWARTWVLLIRSRKVLRPFVCCLKAVA